MQDREQLQKEIDAIRLQLNIADMSAITAPDGEKEQWEQKRAFLQTRLDRLQKDLEESVVYDGDHAASIIDDATADAMLNEILAATDNREQANSDVTDKMADAMIDRILSADESDIPKGGDAIFSQIMLTDDPDVQHANSDDKMADAMVGNILVTPKADDSAHEETYTEITDAAADAMLNEILSASDDSAVSVESEPVIMSAPPVGEPVFVMPQTDNSETVYVAPQTEIGETVFVTPAPQSAESVIIAPESEKSEQALVIDEIKQEPVAEKIVAPEPKAETVLSSDFTERLSKVTATEENSETLIQIEKLKLEAEDAFRRANAALSEAERIKAEAEKIKLNAETERAMYSAEMELQRGLRAREENIRQSADKAEKDRIAEKIARRKAEITEIRNGLQDVKDSDSAFNLREKFFAVQLVLDEDERNSPEITYLIAKSMDDLNHAVEIADLKRRIAALIAVKKAPAKKAAAPKKKAAAKKTAKKKKAVAMARRRPPMRSLSRRRPVRSSPRYR